MTAKAESSRFWSVIYAISAAVAVLPAGFEAAVFVHDRVVVRQDFACLERHLAGEGRKLDELTIRDTFPACNIDSRKPFGQRSSRAWRNGVPSLWFSMNTDQVRRQLLMGLPFLVASSWLAFRRRGLARLTLVVASWLLLSVCLAAIQWPPDLARSSSESAAGLESTVLTYWWVIRVTSIAWVAALVSLVVMGYRERRRTPLGDGLPVPR